MKKIKKSFVEKIYKGLIFNDTLVDEVQKRDPMLIKNDGKMVGFRFFDQELIVDGDNIYKGNKSNYSDIVYFGKRYTKDEILNKYKYNHKYPIYFYCISTILLYGSMEGYTSTLLSAGDGIAVSFKHEKTGTPDPRKGTWRI